VLQYSGGSPCGTSSSDKDKIKDKRSSVHEGAKYKSYTDEDNESKKNKSSSNSKDVSTTSDKDKEKEKEKDTTTTRRKSATISFLCDRDPASTQAVAAFVGTDPDECAYFFEVRSQHACAGAEPHKPGSVGPGSVFAIIFFIAVLVYLIGGVFYQRTVAHARGWRQLPNYTFWSSCWSFISVSRLSRRCCIRCCC
jgi:cation-dependent mannose-6-phosphate receptor